MENKNSYVFAYVVKRKAKSIINFIIKIYKLM